jgi:hypothetical protein
MTQQPTLFPYVPPVASTDAPVNPVAVDVDRRSRNKDRVLARLEHGPATNVELVAIGGMRAMARVWELKQQGKSIAVVRQRGGLWLVRLEP